MQELYLYHQQYVTKKGLWSQKRGLALAMLLQALGCKLLLIKCLKQASNGSGYYSVGASGAGFR